MLLDIIDFHLNIMTKEYCCVDFQEKRTAVKRWIWFDLFDLTLSSFLGSCSLMRALVRRRNQREISLTRALTAFLPVARARLVALCLCPRSIGSENLFLKCPVLPRQPGMALKRRKKHIKTDLKYLQTHHFAGNNVTEIEKLTYQSMTHHSSSRLFCKMVPVRPILIWWKYKCKAFIKWSECKIQLIV